MIRAGYLFVERRPEQERPGPQHELEAAHDVEAAAAAIGGAAAAAAAVVRRAARV